MDAVSNNVDDLIERFDRWMSDNPDNGSIRHKERVASFAMELRDALEDSNPICETCGDIHLTAPCWIATQGWEYAVARKEWPSVPVFRQRSLEAAERFVATPPLGETRTGWIIIKRVAAGPWEKQPEAF